MTKTELMAEIIAKQDELISFYGKDISDNAMFLKIHQIETSNEDCQKGESLRNEISSLRQQLEKAQGTDVSSIKAYKCTDCQEITNLKDNGEIRVGFCGNCGHPLWNPAESDNK